MSKQPTYELDRNQAIPAILGNHEDFLIVTGLAGTARDLGFLTKDGDHVYTMAGAMGAATAMGLGLALAQPERRVLVVTGDGELLMNVGTLSTVGVLNPPNLSILCVDNGHYGETGWQQSHTSKGVDLEAIARGSGISATRTVETEADLEAGAKLLREGNGASFVLMRVTTSESPKFKRDMDPSSCRVRFRRALLGRVAD
ncbi:MAG: thiamine pyrophosphate-binding protein [Gammaproteobacteria bacterium]|nr:thiamine pyrophosphate-binding protein [Gammaproteobacteria bacterium]